MSRFTLLLVTPIKPSKFQIETLMAPFSANLMECPEMYEAYPEWKEGEDKRIFHSTLGYDPFGELDHYSINGLSATVASLRPLECPLFFAMLRCHTWTSRDQFPEMTDAEWIIRANSLWNQLDDREWVTVLNCHY